MSVAGASAGASEARDGRLVVPGERELRPAIFRELVINLARREISASHRMTVLGWAWPLVRQLAQLATLVFIFGSVVKLGIPHFPVYVFSGLVLWTWFSTGIGAATTTLLAQRHLLFQPRFPTAALPVVSIAIPLVDVLLALPVLLVLALVERGLEWTTVLLPLLVVVQLVLMCGIAWIASAASVYFRDVPNLVLVALQILFYMTPVFYGLRSIPHRYAHVLELNPMTILIEANRALLLGDPAPSAWQLAYLCGVAVVAAALGYRFFRRLCPDFVDNL